MKNLLDVLSEKVGLAFEQAGYDAEMGRVTVSNRPDLCEYQCSGCMAGAKKYHKAPLQIAEDVAKAIDTELFSKAEVCPPGFINLNVSEKFLASFMNDMAASDRYGYETAESPKKVVIDYGGANVAKPLHVGHIRSAVIGEAVKRMLRFDGNEVVGDVHLGDWGLQMGMVIIGVKERHPELPYFDPDFTGEYPAEAPFTISELEQIYPAASGRAKEDEEFKKLCLEATSELQAGRRGYRALWNHIMNVSVTDLKKNYGALNVDFDLWKGESDVNDIIPVMVDELKAGGFAHESDGALVVDVKEETDTKEIPPCIILKSDGAALYDTTDLATIKDRVATIDPDHIVYVVDKRQGLHFEQVFRCARKDGMVKPETELTFLGFGTMNGKDGKPFKTRDGGVLRLETLINYTKEEMLRKIREGRPVSEEDAEQIADVVAVAALKYGDLSNQASKDYIFDEDKFTSFEGNTGPYVLYTIVRIKSIMARYENEGGKDISGVKIGAAKNPSEKALHMELARFAPSVKGAINELAPHRVCGYIYDLANAFNSFYHETPILSEEGERKEELIKLLSLTRGVLETCIDMLGFSAPDRM
jgi:arginyl-tRNA synthetase